MKYFLKWLRTTDLVDLAFEIGIALMVLGVFVKAIYDFFKAL